MKSKDDNVELVDCKFLRIGMYVELDVGWLAHPFPTGSFKLTVYGQNLESLLDLIQGV